MASSPHKILVVLASVREGRQGAKVGQCLLKHFAPLTNLHAELLGKSNKVFFVKRNSANSLRRSLFTSLASLCKRGDHTCARGRFIKNLYGINPDFY